MDEPTQSTRDLILLEEIEHNPEATQANLAAQLGVAVGTVNWHIKRLIDKGYVKVRRAERKKLLYIITPEGIALRARLTLDYIKTSFHLYRATRERMVVLLEEVRQAGFNQINLVGDGDVTDVCRLTCLEQGITIVNDEFSPVLEVRGWKVLLCFNSGPERGGNGTA